MKARGRKNQQTRPLSDYDTPGQVEAGDDSCSGYTVATGLENPVGRGAYAEISTVTIAVHHKSRRLELIGIVYLGEQYAKLTNMGPNLLGFENQ